MKLFSKKHSKAAARNADGYNRQASDASAQSTVTGAVVESMLNPFFVLGRH